MIFKFFEIRKPKGQRQTIYYGNGTGTAYTYDAYTFRITQLLTTKSGNTYQDLNYWYDPVGNVTTLNDASQRALYFNNSVTLPEQGYTYDALYRLIIANGREQIGAATFGANDNYNDSAWMGVSQPGDDNYTQNYIQKYAYDEVGNIQSLQHIADAGSYTRNYNYDTASNKLLNTVVGANTYANTYDARGNITSMPHLSSIIFDAENCMAYTDLGGGGDAYYQYSGGQRERKTIINGAITEERIYLGSYEIYRKYTSGTLDIERTTVHISDDTGRIAMLEVRTVGTDPAPSSLVRYIYSNHIGTASLELDDSAAIISYEEYHPYGTTSYQAMNVSINAVAKLYRYTGKERDEETGLYYIGARYYAPWLTRWMACDPINNEWYNHIYGRPQRNHERQFVELTASSYEYCYANPVRFTDPTREQAWQLPKDDATHVAPIIVPKTILIPLSKPKSKNELGSLSEHYETGGHGPGTVSSGMVGKGKNKKADPGGVSYGSYQFTSKTKIKGGEFQIGGTVKTFINSKEGAPWKANFSGLVPGSKEFSASWKKIAAGSPEAFKGAQHDFIEKTHYDVAKNNLKDFGLDIDKRSATLRDVVWSGAVQLGPGNHLFQNALKGKDVSKLSDSEIIKSVYEERGSAKGNALKYFSWANNEASQKPLLTRFKSEMNDALKTLSQEKK